MAKAISELHATPLKRTKVPISYGLPAYDPAWAVQKDLFPNSGSRVLGGCLIDDAAPTNATVLVCSDCRAAEQKWRRENDAEDFW